MTGSISMAVENSANPLLAGLEPERQVEPLSFVIFGANGDLTKRKLIPAVYALFMQGLLPRSFVLLGTSRTHFSHEEFRNAMKEALLKFASDLPLRKNPGNALLPVSIIKPPTPALKPASRISRKLLEHSTKSMVQTAATSFIFPLRRACICQSLKDLAIAVSWSKPGPVNRPIPGW